MNQVKIFVLIFISALAAYATNNPQIRACNVTGGQFFSVFTEEQDQLGLCRYGEALIGSIDILNKDETVTLSIENYRAGIRDCETFNLTLLKTFNGEYILACRYNDGSVIDIETLKTGYTNERNDLLNKALGLGSPYNN